MHTFRKHVANFHTSTFDKCLQNIYQGYSLEKPNLLYLCTFICKITFLKNSSLAGFSFFFIETCLWFFPTSIVDKCLQNIYQGYSLEKPNLLYLCTFICKISFLKNSSPAGFSFFFIRTCLWFSLRVSLINVYKIFINDTRREKPNLLYLYIFI